MLKNIYNSKYSIYSIYKKYNLFNNRLIFLENSKESINTIKSKENKSELPSWQSVEKQLSPKEMEKYQQKLNDFLKISKINAKNLAILREKEQKLMKELDYASWEQIENAVRDLAGPGLAGAGIGIAVGAPIGLASLSVMNYVTAVDNIMIKIDHMNLEEIRQATYEMDNYANQKFKNLQQFKKDLRKKYS